MQEVYKVYKKLFIPLLNYFGSLLVALLIGAFAWAQAHWRRLFLRAFAWARAQWKLMLESGKKFALKIENLVIPANDSEEDADA